MSCIPSADGRKEQNHDEGRTSSQGDEEQEEHRPYAGISEALVQDHPVKQALLGIRDSFGESGSPEELLAGYGLTPEDIAHAAKGL